MRENNLQTMLENDIKKKTGAVPLRVCMGHTQGFQDRIVLSAHHHVITDLRYVSRGGEKRPQSFAASSP